MLLKLLNSSVELSAMGLSQDVLLDIYPHNSLDDVVSQIVEREVLKCLTYLALEQQAAKGLFSIEQLF